MGRGTVVIVLYIAVLCYAVLHNTARNATKFVRFERFVQFLQHLCPVRLGHWDRYSGKALHAMYPAHPAHYATFTPPCYQEGGVFGPRNGGMTSWRDVSPWLWHFRKKKKNYIFLFYKYTVVTPNFPPLTPTLCVGYNRPVIQSQ